MKKPIFLTFEDLSASTKDRIISLVTDKIIKNEKDEIIDEYGIEALNGVVSEKVDHELLNLRFVFRI